LWEISKKLEFEGEKLLLIFDQFENLQGFSTKQINLFKKEIFDLLNSKIPHNIYNSIEKKISSFYETSDREEENIEINQAYLLLSQPSIAKVLFIIREDKLGIMSLLSDYFPDILKNDIIIKPLSQNAAIEALVEPARADGDFLSPKFEFDNKEICIDLVKKIADDETGLVDPIQLQIVAKNIENLIIKEKNKTLIYQKDIPEISDIINKYYNDCWEYAEKKLRYNHSKMLEVRKKIISELIINNRRSLADFGNLEAKSLLSKTINILVSEGLIRVIKYDKNTTLYQLCHDRLIEPINTDILRFEEIEKVMLKSIEDKRKIEEERKKQEKEFEERIKDEERKKEIEKQQKEFEEKLKEEERKTQIESQRIKYEELFKDQARKNEIEREKRKKSVIIVAAVISIILIVIFSIILIRNDQKSSESMALATLKNIRKTNPTFSYVFAKKFFSENSSYRSVKSFIAQFDTSLYAFQLGSFPFSNTIIDVEANMENNQIEIIDQDNITTWNTKTGLIEKQTKLKEEYYIKKVRIEGEDYLLIINDDSLKVQRINGSVVKKFLAPYKDESIDISSNGKYIILDNTICDYTTGKIIGEIPESGYDSYNRIGTIFLNDNRHIAVGDWGGDKIIYRIDEKHKEKIRITAVYQQVKQKKENYSASYFSSAYLSCITVDSKDRFLLAGNQKSQVEIWKLDSLDYIDSVYSKLTQKQYLNSVYQKKGKSLPYKILEGHNGKISSVSISPDDSLILSGSIDNTAILWELESGKKLAVLKGSNSDMIYTGFAGNGKEFVTGTEDGLLFMWSKEKAKELEKKNLLARFTPFDYYNIGLGKMDKFYKKIYDTSNIINYFSSMLHYIINMPSNNPYPDDKDYIDNLKYSLTEIDTMYSRLIAKKTFEKSFSKENKALLYTSYNHLKLITPELLLQAELEEKKSKYELWAQFIIRDTKVLFLDTSDLNTAIYNATQIELFGDYFRDSLKAYSKACYYYETGKKILETFYKKYGDDEDLKSQLGITYGGLSYSYLFTKDYLKAIDCAKKGIALDPEKNDWIYTNLALGYLLSGQTKKADDIYSSLKAKDYSDKSKSFKDAFLGDFTALENAGIVDKNDKKLNYEIIRIKSEILKVKK
jgi:WD40 repeat protein